MPLTSPPPISPPWIISTLALFYIAALLFPRFLLTTPTSFVSCRPFLFLLSSLFPLPVITSSLYKSCFLSVLVLLYLSIFLSPSAHQPPSPPPPLTYVPLPSFSIPCILFFLGSTQPPPLLPLCFILPPAVFHLSSSFPLCPFPSTIPHLVHVSRSSFLFPAFVSPVFQYFPFRLSRFASFLLLCFYLQPRFK